MDNCVLIPLGLTAEASAADAEIHKKNLGPGTSTLIISNEEMENIMKIVKWNNSKWSKRTKRRIS